MAAQVFSLVLFFDKGYGQSPRVGCKSYGIVSMYGRDRKFEFKHSHGKNGHEEEIEWAEKAIKSLKEDGRKGEAYREGWRLLTDHSESVVTDSDGDYIQNKIFR